MTQRQANLLDLMNRAPGRILARDEISTAWGASCNPTALFGTLNPKLAAAGVKVVNVPRQGYRLEKL